MACVLLTKISHLENPIWFNCAIASDLDKSTTIETRGITCQIHQFISELELDEIKWEIIQNGFSDYHSESLFQSHRTLTKGGLTSSIMVNVTRQCAAQSSAISDRHVLLVSLRPFNYSGQQGCKKKIKQKTRRKVKQYISWQKKSVAAKISNEISPRFIWGLNPSRHTSLWH